MKTLIDNKNTKKINKIDTGRKYKNNGIERTPELLAEIYKAASVCHVDKYIYEALGISYTTWYTWLAEVDSEGKPNRYYWAELSDTLKKARSKRVQSNIANIIKHAEKHWQASAWLLERQHPEHFSKSDGLDSDVVVAAPKSKRELKLIEELLKSREKYKIKLRNRDESEALES